MSSRLTAKQEAFSLAYFNGGNASDAYRVVYAPKKASAKTINEAGSRLLKNSKVAARVKSLRDAVAKKAQMTIEGHLEDLKGLRNKAARKGQFGAAVSAEVSRGRASGFYIEKTELTGKDGTPLVGGAFVLPGVLTPEEWERAAKVQQGALACAK
jgi:phage terminase small subunit